MQNSFPFRISIPNSNSSPIIHFALSAKRNLDNVLDKDSKKQSLHLLLFLISPSDEVDMCTFSCHLFRFSYFVKNFVSSTVVVDNPMALDMLAPSQVGGGPLDSAFAPADSIVDLLMDVTTRLSRTFVPGNAKLMQSNALRNEPSSPKCSCPMTVSMSSMLDILILFNGTCALKKSRFGMHKPLGL